ncbi:cGMP-dependent protein kinase [Pseudoscourfieldia marina]
MGARVSRALASSRKQEATVLNNEVEADADPATPKQQRDSTERLVEPELPPLPISSAPRYVTVRRCTNRVFSPHALAYVCLDAKDHLQPVLVQPVPRRRIQLLPSENASVAPDKAVGTNGRRPKRRIHEDEDGDAHTDSSTRDLAMLRKLDHPRIVSVAGTITSRLGHEPYAVLQALVYDYPLNGPALLQPNPATPVPWPRIWHACRDVVAGLRYLHARGFAHRDLTPQSILWDDFNERAMVANLEHARICSSGGDNPVSCWHVTPAPLGHGHARCRAPEAMPDIAPGYFAGFPADVYAFGAVIRDFLCGTGDGAPHASVDDALFPSDLPLPSGMSRSHIREAVNRCMTPEPHLRPVVGSVATFAFISCANHVPLEDPWSFSATLAADEAAANAAAAKVIDYRLIATRSEELQMCDPRALANDDWVQRAAISLELGKFGDGAENAGSSVLMQVPPGQICDMQAADMEKFDDVAFVVEGSIEEVTEASPVALLEMEQTAAEGSKEMVSVPEPETPESPPPMVLTRPTARSFSERAKMHKSASSELIAAPAPALDEEDKAGASKRYDSENSAAAAIQARYRGNRARRQTNRVGYQAPKGRRQSGEEEEEEEEEDDWQEPTPPSFWAVRTIPAGAFTAEPHLMLHTVPLSARPSKKSYMRAGSDGAVIACVSKSVLRACVVAAAGGGAHGELELLRMEDVARESRRVRFQVTRELERKWISTLDLLHLRLPDLIDGAFYTARLAPMAPFCVKGATPRHCYYLLSGEAELTEDRRRARGMGEPLMPGTFIGDLACLLSKEGRSASAHAGPGGCEVVVVERSSLLRTSRLDDVVWRGLSLAGEDCWRTQQAKEAKEELIRRAKNRGGD